MEPSAVSVAVVCLIVVIGLLYMLDPRNFIVPGRVLSDFFVRCTKFFSDNATTAGSIMTATIAAVVFGVIVMFVSSTTESLVHTTICPASASSWLVSSNPCNYRAVPPPNFSPFVARTGLVSEIVDTIEHGARFIVLDGANSMGKSKLAKIAAAALSSTHAVQSIECTVDDTATSVLIKLLLPRHNFVDHLLSVLPAPFRPVPLTPSFDALSDALLNLPSYRGHEPVFVVEMAERLSVVDLKTLLDLAKHLVDELSGRFIFVFSPSDKLSNISGFGSMTRARVVSVGDLTEQEAFSFLQQLNCDSDSAKAVHLLVDGHLPYLLDDDVRSFCLRKVSLGALQSHFAKHVRSIFMHVDQELDCGVERCACAAACAVRDGTKLSDLVRAIPLLLKEHVVRVSLADKVRLIDSRLILCYMARECNCGNSSYIVTPPCGL